MSDKVISLADRKNKAKEKSENADKAKDNDDTPHDFNAEIERNKKNAERLAKERANKNNGVKRSHNLRPNDPNNKR
jgi:hypothetical protein